MKTKTETLLENYKLRLKDSGHALTEPTRRLLEKKIAELSKQTNTKTQ
tara:strand:- start:941 stop:1084 length:144 start_codon:yes stop_codon:yes gene_type:complete